MKHLISTFLFLVTPACTNAGLLRRDDPQQISYPTNINASDKSRYFDDALANLGRFAQVTLNNAVDRLLNSPQGQGTGQRSQNLLDNAGRPNEGGIMEGLAQLVPNGLRGRLMNCPRCQQFDDTMLTGSWRMVRFGLIIAVVISYALIIWKSENRLKQAVQTKNRNDAKKEVYASDNFIKVHLEAMMKMSANGDSVQSGNVQQGQQNTVNALATAVQDFLTPFQLPTCVKWQVGAATTPDPSTAVTTYQMQYAFRSGTLGGALRFGYGAIQKSTSPDFSFTLRLNGDAYPIRFCLLNSNFNEPPQPGPFPTDSTAQHTNATSPLAIIGETTVTNHVTASTHLTSGQTTSNAANEFDASSAHSTTRASSPHESIDIGGTVTNGHSPATTSAHTTGAVSTGGLIEEALSPFPANTTRATMLNSETVTASILNATQESSDDTVEPGEEEGIDWNTENEDEDEQTPASLVRRDIGAKANEKRAKRAKREASKPLYMILSETSSVSSCQNFLVLTNNEQLYFEQLDTEVIRQMGLLSADNKFNPLQYIGCPCGFNPFK